MDIHRCRFVPYRPQSINAVAFSHPLHDFKTKTPADLRLALGRENGDVEIWNPVGANWIQERILRGSRGRTVEQLVFTQELLVDEDNKERPTKSGNIRLFSSGGSQSITEWSLSTGSPRRNVEGNSASIWCFAAQPQWRRNTAAQHVSKVAGAPSQLLAAGCADGSVTIFSTSDDDLQYLRVVGPAPAKRSKVISITWRDRNTIIAGHEDGFIRVIDVPNRKVLRTMHLGKSGDHSSSIVWAVTCLPDGTILSGDSSGELKVWDAANYSLTQRLQSHEADILSIATSLKGDMIFTTGVDRRTVNYRLVDGQSGDKRARWQPVMHRKYHRHDVKALAAFESKDMSILVSGGVDTALVVLPLRNFDTEYHRQLTHLPQKSQMSCSTRTRLMITWWGQDIFVFHLPRRASEVELMEDVLEDNLNHKLVARIQLKDDENITSAQISEDGKMIVVATAAGVKLFQLRSKVHVDTKEIEVRTRSLDLPMSVAPFAATSVGFSPDSKWIYTVRPTNIIALVKIVAGESPKDKPTIHEKPVKLGRKARKSYESKLGSHLQYVNSVVFSSDSRVMATGDLSGGIDVWILEGHEDLNGNEEKALKVVSTSSSESDSDSDSDSDDDTDSSIIHGQKWIRNPTGSDLPKLDSAIIALSFKPQAQHIDGQGSSLGLHATRHTPNPVSHEYPTPDAKLIAISSSHQMVEFDVLASKLSDWSRRNPSSCLPAEFTQIKDRAMGAFWDCSSISATSPDRYERLWLYGPSWMFMLDMSRDLSTDTAPEKIGKLGKYDVKEPASATEDRKAILDSSSNQGSRKRKRNTGAGDKIKEGQWQLTQPATQLNGHGTDQHTHASRPLSPVSNEDSDSDVEIGDSNILQIRRKNLTSDYATTTDAAIIPTSNTNPESNLRSKSKLRSSSSSSSTPYFHTFRYRAIYGISVLSPSPDTSTSPFTSMTTSDSTSIVDSPSPANNLEIIVVERPLYDIEFEPRLDVGEDWAS